MAGAESPNEGGIRRRHSGQHEDSDGEVDVGHDGVQTGTRSIDNTRQSADQEHRVRFSQDIERRPSNKKRKSDEIVGTSEDGSDKRSKVPNLSVDTHAASEGRVTGITGEGSFKSPTSTINPVSPQYELGSPKSARSRGMSLRSSLFMRNMGRRKSTEIELEDVGSSSGESGSNTRPQTAKKESRTSITVTPVETEFSNSIKPPATAQTGSALPNYQQWVKKNARKHLPLDRVQEVLETIRKFVLRIQEIPPSKSGRHIPLDASRKLDLIDERTGKLYVSNLIRSSKYTPWNFL